MATVTVTITDANEPAKWLEAAEADANVTLYIDENETVTDTAPEQLALRQNEADRAETAADDGTNVNPTAYTATDEDDDTNLDANAAIRYSVEGADAKHFTIGESDGVLTFMSGDDLLGADGANFEGQNSYSITIVATSGGTDTSDPIDRTIDDVDRTRYATLGVTIKVVDQEDPGEVKFPHVREPQEGKSVLATHSDPDGGVTGLSWTWYRSPAIDGDPADTADTALDDCLTAAGLDGNGTAATGTAAWAVISGANSPIYTPPSYTFDHDDDGDADSPTAEVGYCLRATATYSDNIVTDADTTTDGIQDVDMAHKVSDRPVQKDDPANAAPEFPKDNDPNMPGDQEVAERSVPENTKGKVGEPVVADDKDLLIYTVDDTDNFSVDNDGQISTAVELDYEALPEDAKYYMVTLTATDPSGASDSIMVKITVTDGPDVAIIALAGGGPSEPDHPCVAGEALDADASVGLANDCQILLDAKDELEGDGTELNWSLDTPIGDWDGVASGTGRVYRIHLADRGLAGQIPAGFNGLDALERLTLRDNDLTGGIPDLSDLDNLEWLILKGNMLSGEIPATLGDMDMLDYLWLYDNDLSGEIPAELGNAATLRQIRLDRNALTGEIPGELGQIGRLRYLTLSNNMLTGEIPAELGDATNLKALWLNSNMLTGMIPAELGSIMTAADDTLRLLYLSHNMLSGDVPSELGNLVSLTAGRGLRLSGNMLTGCIPAAIFDAASDADAAGLEACP